MLKLTSHFPALPEYKPDADIDLEAQTRQQSEIDTANKILGKAFICKVFAGIRRADIPRAPPPSYTPENRATNVQNQSLSHIL